MGRLHVVTCTIAASGTASTPVPLQGLIPVAVVLGDWTTADLSFEGSALSASGFTEVRNASQVALNKVTAAVANGRYVLANEMPFEYLKVISGAGQAAARTVTLVLEEKEMGARLHSADCTILDGETISSPVRTNGLAVAAIVLGGWTTADITFQGCETVGGTYTAALDTAQNPQAKITAAVANKRYPIAAALPFEFLRVVSGATQTGADRTVTLIFKSP